MASIQLSRYEAEEGDLPDACMRCGEPATERKRRLFISHPLWVYLLMPFCLLPYLIVAAIFTQRVHCYTLFCPRHRNHFGIRTFLVWAALPVVLATIVGGFVLVISISKEVSKSMHDLLPGLLCFGTFALIFIWLLSIPLMQETAIHTADVTEDGVTLKRVSPTFVEAVWDHREERERELRQEEDQRGKFRPRPHDPEGFRGERKRPEK